MRLQRIDILLLKNLTFFYKVKVDYQLINENTLKSLRNTIIITICDIKN